MSMKFGVRAADSTSSNSGDDYIRYFKKGETRIRFLDDIDDWTEYWEHFSQGMSRAYPCTGSAKNCPGCQSENEREAKASKRYLANAMSEGYVNLWKIPASTKAEFDRYADKDSGSILKRDYTMVRMETDSGTKYTVDREERDAQDLTEYTKSRKDHQQLLMEAFIEVWGQAPNEDGGVDLVSPVRPKVVKEEPVKVSQDPPSEPQDQPDSDSGVIDELELRKMSSAEIKALFTRCGLQAPETDDSEKLANALMEALN